MQKQHCFLARYEILLTKGHGYKWEAGSCMDKRYTISQLSKEYDIPTSTLRFYQRTGLLSPSYKDPDNGYAYYTSEQIRTLLLVTFLRELDMPVNDIRDILATAGSRREIFDALEKHKAALAAQIQDLVRRQKKIEELCAAGQQPYDTANEPFETFFRRVYKTRTILWRAHAGPVPLNDNEWHMKFRKYSQPNEWSALEFPRASIAVGFASSLAEFRRTGEIRSHSIFLEPYTETTTDFWRQEQETDVEYLCIRYHGGENRRPQIYSALLDHVLENELETDDVILDTSLNSNIPPVYAAEDVFELSIKLVI